MNKTTLTDWRQDRGPFGVCRLTGRNVATGQRWTATMKAMQGGPDKWRAWTDRGEVRMVGWPERLF